MIRPAAVLSILLAVAVAACEGLAGGSHVTSAADETHPPKPAGCAIDVYTAEDVAQEAFTRLFVNWAKISRYERPGAWVRRVAIRLAVRHARRERMRVLLLRWVEPPRHETAASDPDLIRAIQALPPQQRAAVAFHYFEDRPVAEIAGILSCSPATAKVHLFKARKRLAFLLHERDEEGDDAT